VRFDPALRSLDAVHAATALGLRSLWAFVTYDDRQAAAAREAGLSVVSPGMRG
jgi:predicted nucleic acid-binding protein